jgi:MFS family permease
MKKWTVVGLFWFVQVFTDIIRVSFAVVAPALMNLYDITPQAMGYVLSAWNWTYVGFLPLAGPIVDRLGPWIVLGVGSTVWSLATLALPLAAGVGSLFLMRALFGFGHSVRFPAQASAITRWFHPNQRATAVGFCFSGGQVGLATGTMITAFILDRLGWQWVFYCIGSASLLFTLIWFVLYPDKKMGREAVPEGEGEKEEKGSDTPQMRWVSLFTYRSVWGIVFGQVGYLYAYFFFVTWLPGYLILERGMTVLQTGIVASLPFWVGLVGTLTGGGVGDYLIRRGFSRTASRKTMIGVGLTLVTITMVAAAFASQTWLAVTLLTLCMGSMRLITASANSAPMDLAPFSLVASLTAIQNTIGVLSGTLVAVITGYIVGTTGSFVLALLVAGAMALVGALSYVFLVKSFEPLPIDVSHSVG